MPPRTAKGIPAEKVRSSTPSAANIYAGRLPESGQGWPDISSLCRQVASANCDSFQLALVTFRKASDNSTFSHRYRRRMSKRVQPGAVMLASSLAGRFRHSTEARLPLTHHEPLRKGEGGLPSSGKFEAGVFRVGAIDKQRMA